MWEGRQAPTLLEIRDYDSNYLFVFLSFCLFAKIRMMNISAFPRIEIILKGVMEIFVSVSNISNILSKIVQNPCVLYSDHYVANLCLFFIKTTNILREPVKNVLAEFVR